MALGDLIGEVGNTYLTAAERAARAGIKPSLADGFNPAVGPVGRATQQLTSLSQLAPPFTPPAQTATPSLSDALPGSAPAQPAAPAPQLSLSSAAPGGPQPTPPPQPVKAPSLADAGPGAGAALVSAAPALSSSSPSLSDAAPAGVQPDPPAAPVTQQVTSLADAGPSGPPAPVAPQPATLSLDQARPVVGGSDTSNANTSIVGSLAPDGTAQFSNARPDLASAFGQPPVAAPVPPTAARAASLEDGLGVRGGPVTSDSDIAGLGSSRAFGRLGTASNVGDGIGGFSQSNAGDAALAFQRNTRALDLRQAYREQDALAEARRKASVDDSVRVVGDSSKPLTRSDLAQAGLDQQERDNDQKDIASAQDAVTTGIAQRAATTQARQAQNLEDLRAAASAPNATPQQKAAYAAVNDPDGSKAFARQVQQAQLAKTNAETDKTNAETEAERRKAAGLPPTLQKLEDDDVLSIGTGRTINGELSRIDKQLGDGSLQLGLVKNQVSAAKNLAGYSDDNSANFASLNATLERLRNDSLRLNAGPQTEGDAQRAWNELITNINDPKIVRKRIAEIQALNEKSSANKLSIVQNRRTSQGAQPLDINKVLGGSSPVQAQQQAGGGASGSAKAPGTLVAGSAATGQQSIAAPSAQRRFTFDEAKSLPSGTEFIDSNGIPRIKH